LNSLAVCILQIKNESERTTCPRRPTAAAHEHTNNCCAAGHYAKAGKFRTKTALKAWRRLPYVGQRQLAELVGVAFTAFCKLDYFVGDYRANRIGLVLNPQRHPRHFERDAHDSYGLSVELLTI
jgi:hypothetical protein